MQNPKFKSSSIDALFQSEGMSDFDDSDESIFSDASSSYYDDIFSDEPPSQDSRHDLESDVEESFLETSSNEREYTVCCSRYYFLL